MARGRRRSRRRRRCTYPPNAYAYMANTGSRYSIRKGRRGRQTGGFLPLAALAVPALSFLGSLIGGK